MLSDPHRVAVRCDIGPRVGVGHVMRCLALAEELQHRGADICFICDAQSVPWVHHQIEQRGMRVTSPVETAAEHVALCRRLGVDAVVFDSYLLDPEVYVAVQDAGLRTLAVVDGDPRGAAADVMLDQNVGAELDKVDLPAGVLRLAGLDYVLLRDDVVALRPGAPPPARDVHAPRVVAVFGGTDARGVCPLAVSELASTGCPFEATVVVARPELRRAVEKVVLSAGQSVTAVEPTGQLPVLIKGADLVVGAAGSATWEVLCLGIPAGLVCVADNQRSTYERLQQAGACVGLGHLEDLISSPQSAVEGLRSLLVGAKYRSSLADAGWRLVDGLGRRRVVEMWLGLSATEPGTTGRRGARRG